MCGCANAAGIGLAAGLVFLQGGGEEELSYDVNNMVANVTGMICDGGKVGCGLLRHPLQVGSEYPRIRVVAAPCHERKVARKITRMIDSSH